MHITRIKDLAPDACERLMQRAGADVQRVMPQVQDIMADVRERGDTALRDYAARFDGAAVDDIRVSEDEIAEAKRQVAPELLTSLQQARDNIERFHRQQLPAEDLHELQPGVRTGRLWRPIERVGLYAPGGKALYPSTVLMLGVPAMVAGCERRVLCMPPQADGSLPAVMLAAADCVGIRDVFKAGGAQAIAAMTFGTERVPPVYKIFGPGSVYVVAAKICAASSGLPIAIDCPPGPSEVLIIADHTAQPAFVAADLLSQAEHGEDSAAILLTPSESLAQEVQAAVERQVPDLPEARARPGGPSTTTA